MHLASHLALLSDDKLQLVAEGVECYNLLSDIKKRALPYFPNGFCRFGDEMVCSGLLDGNDLYLAVWNLSAKNKAAVKLDKTINKAEVFEDIEKWLGGAEI
jgi:alpha-galactosidase